MASQSILTHRVITSVALAFSIWANLRYALGRAPVEKDPEDDPFFRVGFTPFTANILFIIIYWGVLHLLQILFVAQYFFPDAAEGQNSEISELSSSRLEVAQTTGWYFTLFNILQLIWVLLFSHGHYILAELVVILNFFNILVLYLVSKSYKIKNLTNYLLIHIPTAAFPVSWLLYALFWNGAVAIGSQSLASRIVANVFIWQFLIIPGFFLVFYRDWAIGLSSAYLVLGLAIGQIFTKLFALQWIFALIISALLFLASIAVWSGNLGNSSATSVQDGENAPLINN
ncbi:hypothetical protein WICMUC_003819 [Wickerhamomyces mucosus]|uniref:DUF1774-domain-containing protein n=1 Tax=Wickerhamomyces mucosus TaxID=1378264 RepID=A0A9P8TBP1_9ASCO|nr:hypothetical protein WICMUC_003819 [Wickerhamomyces mucosus]